MKKIGLLALALVLALGTMGVGYALWSDTLFVQGNVDTGNISAYWTCYAAYDTEDANKNYSSVTCAVTSTATTGDRDILTITLVDAYPCIDYYVVADVHNNGSLPIHVCGITQLTNTLPAGCTVELLKVTAKGSGGFPPATLPTLIAWTPFEQIHPEGVAYVAFHVHLNNDVVQDASATDQSNFEYTFSYELDYQQWNEPCQ